jgi:hypothetical protein
MKNLIWLMVVAAVWCSNAQAQKTTPATPTEESTKLATKQIDSEITQLKDAIEGMKTAISKGDKAEFRLYRAQAKDALISLDKLVSAEMVTESRSSAKGTASPSPSSAAAETSPTAEASASASVSPSPQ